MRTRSITRKVVEDSLPAEFYSLMYTNPALSDFESLAEFGAPRGSTAVETSTITDSVQHRGEVYLDKKTLTWRRLRRPRLPKIDMSWDGPGLARHQLRPINPCTHSTVRIKPVKGFETFWSVYRDLGSPVWERSESSSRMYSDGAQFARLRFGAEWYANLNNSSFHPGYTSGDWIGHDWFALADSFDEASSQILSSSSMLGESIYESAIFVDALKCVINPTNAIRLLLKAAGRHGKKMRRMTLGQASRYIAKRSANSYLTTKFGILPAVEDIKSALLAHSRVKDRLAYLRARGGKFVPVRVRQDTYSDIANLPLELTTSFSSYQWHCDSKMSRAVVGGWCRVREDLSFGDTWSAYLQHFGVNKVAGLVWELIPFSFVADWFTNAQERINRLTRFRTGSPFSEITNLWASEKKTVADGIYFLPGYESTYSAPLTRPNSPSRVLDRESIQYNRYTSIPDTSGVFDFSTLGPFHLLASGALILQRTLR